MDSVSPALGFDAAAPVPPFKFGTEAHKALFCRALLDTHDPYRPALIDWPKLDPATRDKIVSLPVWDMAVQTEGRTGLFVRSFAETVTDPLLREAVEMDAFEEARHKTVLADMVRAYGIALEPEPPMSARAIPNGRSCAPAIRSASTASSASACSASRGTPASSRMSWSIPSSR